jgi:hypothetical protein
MYFVEVSINHRAMSLIMLHTPNNNVYQTVGRDLPEDCGGVIHWVATQEAIGSKIEFVVLYALA